MCCTALVGIVCKTLPAIGKSIGQAGLFVVAKRDAVRGISSAFQTPTEVIIRHITMNKQLEVFAQQFERATRLSFVSSIHSAEDLRLIMSDYIEQVKLHYEAAVQGGNAEAMDEVRKLSAKLRTDTISYGAKLLRNLDGFFAE